ncbi:hypothetical protein BO94DRAFT_391978 [Aspergillus sclerotioniger CBS 115572]|uniref:Secreted protein n=1 Tax=Aspergillus sclerotioniger CBS 115572 TaxID=1450535 RepID=A0A317WYF6_9EURO|nr:hypothetical protein BO94DRAFT_391978 [Aspergillus sclerotioniger CBS 115572]PWY91403.1 hypothetical protein BO94DRAFT_391978 [Aspergillus sclerotioniger CBS 115572]
MGLGGLFRLVILHHLTLLLPPLPESGPTVSYPFLVSFLYGVCVCYLSSRTPRMIASRRRHPLIAFSAPTFSPLGGSVGVDWITIPRQLHGTTRFQPRGLRIPPDPELICSLILPNRASPILRPFDLPGS